MKLYFIRHGKTRANEEGLLTGMTETDLTPFGREQARKISKKLPAKFDFYYCSPLKRTHQTLFEIMGNVPYTIDERITEIDSGDWQGKKKTKLPEKEYELYRRGLYNPPNGETFEEINNRICSFLKDMLKKYHNNENILIVTHNGVIRQLKHMLLKNNDDNPSKNLEIFIVTDKMIKEMEG